MVVQYLQFYYFHYCYIIVANRLLLMDELIFVDEIRYHLQICDSLLVNWTVS